MMSDETMLYLSDWLMALMQGSIVVPLLVVWGRERHFTVPAWLLGLVQVSSVAPMVVMWGRKRHFSPPVKLLSGYVYWSLLSSGLMWLLYPAYLASNYGLVIGFNLGKMALFAAVYYQVLASVRLRRQCLVATLVVLAGCVGVIGYDLALAVTISRVAQCTLLAGFALAYLEQTMHHAAEASYPATTHDPLWLLSVGQLLYSAGTVTAFSLDYLSKTKDDQNLKYIFIALSGLVFNFFLTVAFWRAAPPNRLASTNQGPPRSRAATMSWPTEA